MSCNFSIFSQIIPLFNPFQFLFIALLAFLSDRLITSSLSLTSFLISSQSSDLVIISTFFLFHSLLSTHIAIISVQSLIISGLSFNNNILMGYTASGHLILSNLSCTNLPKCNTSCHITVLLSKLQWPYVISSLIFYKFLGFV